MSINKTPSTNNYGVCVAGNINMTNGVLNILSDANYNGNGYGLQTTRKYTLDGGKFAVRGNIKSINIAGDTEFTGIEVKESKNARLLANSQYIFQIEVAVE